MTKNYNINDKKGTLEKNGSQIMKTFRKTGKKWFHHNISWKVYTIGKWRVFDCLDKKTLQQRLINAYKFKNEISVDEMKINLKIWKNTSKVWHDVSTIANHIHIMFANNVIYDKPAFYTII